jgi:hypothetical protein
MAENADGGAPLARTAPITNQSNGDFARGRAWSGFIDYPLIPPEAGLAFPLDPRRRARNPKHGVNAWKETFEQRNTEFPSFRNRQLPQKFQYGRKYRWFSRRRNQPFHTRNGSDAQVAILELGREFLSLPPPNGHALLQHKGAVSDRQQFGQRLVDEQDRLAH